MRGFRVSRRGGWDTHGLPVEIEVEKKLGFQTTVGYLSVWMFIAIFAYWICGWLSDQFGRRFVIPAFAVPAAALIVLIGRLDDPQYLF